MIDRKSLVSRHDPVNRSWDPYSPLTVGNGSFGFTADITGMQTFPGNYVHTEGICLGTQSDWGWHSDPNHTGITWDRYPTSVFNTPYGPRTYLARRDDEASLWHEANPCRIHLGRVGLNLYTEDHCLCTIDDLHSCDQRLDLWSGMITSRFSIGDCAVVVQTCCDPVLDCVAFRVESTMLSHHRLMFAFEFPAPNTKKSGYGGDWGVEEGHESQISSRDSIIRIHRNLPTTAYDVLARVSSPCNILTQSKHLFLVQPSPDSEIEVVVRYSPNAKSNEILPGFRQVAESSARYRRSFWERGGAVDFSESTAEKSFELERRVVLSQYLTSVQCCGSMAPQETGLTQNSWYGKAHLEMHWWHSVHFALWGRADLFERALGWYNSTILPVGKRYASLLGLDGVLIPKCVGPESFPRPNYIESYLVWQQPHPIYYAELLYRQCPDSKTLEKYWELVTGCANCIVSLLNHDQNGTYVLGPWVVPAQENHKPEEVLNPVFEVAYFRFALQTAADWYKRKGKTPPVRISEAIDHLVSLPVIDGVYPAHQLCANTFQTHAWDHPSMLMAYGFVPPSGGADPGVMRKTLETAVDKWSWEASWGWDYPVLAMTAVRLGMWEQAFDLLLMDTQKNRYLPNGHVPQGRTLPVYLPANGGLLSAVAALCAGFYSGPLRPQNKGQWSLHWEGLNPLL